MVEQWKKFLRAIIIQINFAEKVINIKCDTWNFQFITKSVSSLESHTWNHQKWMCTSTSFSLLHLCSHQISFFYCVPTINLRNDYCKSMTIASLDQYDRHMPKLKREPEIQIVNSKCWHVDNKDASIEISFKIISNHNNFHLNNQELLSHSGTRTFKASGHCKLWNMIVSSWCWIFLPSLTDRACPGWEQDLHVRIWEEWVTILKKFALKGLDGTWVWKHIADKARMWSNSVPKTRLQTR